MKILLREYGRERYVWKTAKYIDKAFFVDGERIDQRSIVSIENDNRGRYVQCSCCGKTFRRGDTKKFKQHQVDAIKPETCFGCPNLRTRCLATKGRKYVVDNDGAFKEITETIVDLQCNKSVWNYYDINDSRVISFCERRQCADAQLVEINDFFTRYPGAFDDIVTIDRLLDDGYDVHAPSVYGVDKTIVEDEEYVISVHINQLGIVDYFEVYVESTNDWYTVYYSKRYDSLFAYRREYLEWSPDFVNTELVNEIKERIAKLYR